ncbi:cupin-like domain-containing protein [Streptomyces sp. NPDC002476]|uniref:cupin-like domain-containing protein n=1 Tax=Streptomyces sp. NPDC002476 TaxID=3364648 RepID=UPI0036B39E4E
MLVPVPRVSWADFRPPYGGGEPRVVFGWPPGQVAPQVWSADYLKSVVGEREVPVREVEGPPVNFFQNLGEGGCISFLHYMDWVVETAEAIRENIGESPDAQRATSAIRRIRPERFYYLDAKLERLSKDLAVSLPVPGWYRKKPVDTNFWCGVLGTSCGLHSDVKPNCNTQIVGRKEFVLFPPSQSRFVYRIPGATHCRFDPNAPEFERFPLARRTAGLRCVLRPGESLYIPVGWFHQVTVVSAWAVNVNFFWPRPFPQGLVNRSLWPLLLRRGRARGVTVLRSRRSRLPLPGASRRG